MHKNIFSLFLVILSLTSLRTQTMDFDSWREQFNQSIKENDLPAIQKLMPQSGLIDSTDQHGETPLWLAGCFGHLEVMLEILKNPYCRDIDRASATTPIKRRPLHFVCSKETEKKSLQLEVAEALINKKANLDEPTGYRESPLCLAVRRSNNPALVSLLVDAGAKLERSRCEARQTRSPLDEAIYEVYPEYIPLLLKSPRLTCNTLDEAIDFCKGYIQEPPQWDLTLPTGRKLNQTEIDAQKKKREEILALLLAKKQSLSPQISP